jgi:hypothetical protein
MIVIDDEDEQAEEYYERYPTEVIMFNKREAAKITDDGNNFNDLRAVVYARNVCFSIAEQLGYEYFIELDDDYTGFEYRYGDAINYSADPIRNLDRIFEIMLDYYKCAPFLSIAMAQGGDFIGGKKSKFRDSLARRKCMNSFSL